MTRRVPWGAGSDNGITAGQIQDRLIGILGRALPSSIFLGLEFLLGRPADRAFIRNAFYISIPLFGGMRFSQDLADHANQFALGKWLVNKERAG